MLHEGDYRGAINLGNPAEMTVRELAEQVVRLTGTHSTIAYRPLPVDDPQRRRPDITIARKVLGWTPQVPLAAGLERTIAHFAEVAALEAAQLPLTKRRIRREKSGAPEGELRGRAAG
jgi:UDP-glucuronate decarboxylase